MGGSIEEAVKKVRSNISHAHKIEVECDTFEQVQKCLNAGADIIMLDNMSIDEIKKCISLINKKAIVEVSGNVNMKNLEELLNSTGDVIVKDYAPKMSQSEKAMAAQKFDTWSKMLKQQ